jgi:hypothetical protein
MRHAQQSAGHHARVRGRAWSPAADQTGVMTSLGPAAVDEITTLAQRLEEVMHELRAGVDDEQVGGLVAHSTEVVDRLRELLPARESD